MHNFLVINMHKKLFKNTNVIRLLNNVVGLYVFVKLDESMHL